MAPYTMTIHIVNDTQYSVCPIGSSTMCGLDGETNLVALPVAPRSSGDLKISKTGGIEGLSAAVSWWVGLAFCDKDNKGRFSVYTEMTTLPN
ncbi:hypothetical protein AK830_g9638 [Neonectria ditissima]|uniref:Uncharacterized protein n=1 Tax=Neonectria ditissima TaxID=78410 RepID=A0A0P7B5D6_9HYPO|nr:hypothetical protein AK830_g9638 [Neonectria ditissima]